MYVLPRHTYTYTHTRACIVARLRWLCGRREEAAGRVMELDFRWANQTSACTPPPPVSLTFSGYPVILRVSRPRARIHTRTHNTHKHRYAFRTNTYFLLLLWHHHPYSGDSFSFLFLSRRPLLHCFADYFSLRLRSPYATRCVAQGYSHVVEPAQHSRLQTAPTRLCPPWLTVCTPASLGIPSLGSPALPQ